MLGNYLTIAWRNVLGNPLFSVINVLGLAIGLACCIIITVFVRFELSYDRQFADAERIYRVTRDFYSNNLELAPVAPPIAPLLQADFAEIEAATRILTMGSASLMRGDQLYNEEGIVLADSNVFELFQLEFLAGDAATALANPTDLVLTERAAERYFGDADPIGQSLTFMAQMDLRVVGVIRDLPANTHLAFDLIGSMAAVPLLMGEDQLESWSSNNYFTYIRLPAGYDPEVLQAQLPDFLARHTSSRTSNRLNLQALTDIHLHSNRDSEMQANGSAAVVYTFAVVAVVVLLIACINFMNLTTARSTQRAREVGVRKVVGARRSQLVVQFLSESVLLTAGAMLLAVAFVELTLPAFAAFVEKPLTLELTAEPGWAGVLLATVVIVGLIAGSYPAFYLSRFRPAEVLKGSAGGTGSALLRRCLVVFQFAVSIGLLIATGVVAAQMHYAQSIDLGYDKSRNLVTGLPFFADMWGTYEPLKIELETHPDIESVTYSSRVPGMQNLDGSGYVKQDDPMHMDSLLGLADLKMDYNWFEHYGVEVVAGRAFRENENRVDTPSEEHPITYGAAILNETAARRLGWTPQEAVGKILRQPLTRELELFVERTVVGVVGDIHFASLHDEIKATVFSEPHEIYGRYLSVRLAAGDHRQAIDFFEDTWRRQLPNEPLTWEFLDAQYDALYRSEARQAQMFGLFAGLAIFVATLGLFGLASFTTERRTKEVGIRKVMGASVRDIVLLLTADFTRLVLIANVVAWPLAYLLMREWLTRFAYQAPFSQWGWLFIVAGVAALLVAWLTISVQAARAALSRPVLALRYE